MGNSSRHRVFQKLRTTRPIIFSDPYRADVHHHIASQLVKFMGIVIIFIIVVKCEAQLKSVKLSYIFLSTCTADEKMNDAFSFHVSETGSGYYGLKNKTNHQNPLAKVSRVTQIIANLTTKNRNNQSTKKCTWVIIASFDARTYTLRPFYKGSNNFCRDLNYSTPC